VTGERVVQAAMTQFDPDSIVVERVAKVRSNQRISEVMEQAHLRGATVLYSLVSAERRRHLLHEGRRHNIPAIDLLGPILRRLSEVLAVSPRAEAGLFRQLDEEYYRRIEAVDFAVKHDDGKLPRDLPTADLVLVGVSRSSKTPLSMLLAYRGWRVANVPIVLGLPPPEELYRVERSRVIALTVDPSWLQGIRRERMQRMTQGRPMPYAEIQHIRSELEYFRTLVARGGWTVVEVTHKAVEETAAEIVMLARG